MKTREVVSLLLRVNEWNVKKTACLKEVVHQSGLRFWSGLGCIRLRQGNEVVYEQPLLGGLVVGIVADYLDWRKGSSIKPLVIDAALNTLVVVSIVALIVFILIRIF